MNLIRLSILALSASILSLSLGACGEKNSEQAAATDNAVSTTMTPNSATVLPDNAPEPGLPISAVLSSGGDSAKQNTTETNTPLAEAESSAAQQANKHSLTVKEGVVQLEWEQLIPIGFEPELIMADYIELIESIPEGSPEENALLDEIMDKLNNSPSNAELDSKKVRIPGFVSPLDHQNGVVSEFLLVPYFGACIHVPPPPINQTLLVKPDMNKSIDISRIYEPVWVVGDMRVERVKTDLASAGYIIENAALEVYRPPNQDEEQAVYND